MLLTVLDLFINCLECTVVTSITIVCTY